MAELIIDPALKAELETQLKAYQSGSEEFSAYLETMQKLDAWLKQQESK